MPRKIIIETEGFEDMDDDMTEGFKEEMKEKVHDAFKGFPRSVPHGPDRPQRTHRNRIFTDMDNEVKLFTDKSEMVAYVNQLSNIFNVEIFKIEDELYKVLVTRMKKQSDCCKDEE